MLIILGLGACGGAIAALILGILASARPDGHWLLVGATVGMGLTCLGYAVLGKRK